MDIMGEQVYLRKMTVEDTDRVVAWRNAPHVMEQFIYRTPLTRETHLEWIRTKVETGAVEQFIICIRKSGREIGSFYLRDIDREEGTAELGIFIGERDALGKGYGTEAVRLGVLYGFSSLELQRIILRVFSDNAKAVRNYEKNGFVRIQDRVETVERDGRERTVIFMQIEKEELDQKLEKGQHRKLWHKAGKYGEQGRSAGEKGEDSLS